MGVLRGGQSLYTEANVVAHGGEQEGDRLVVKSDRADHRADSWAWPHTTAHPAVLAIIAALRADLWALPHERQATSLPSPHIPRRAFVEVGLNDQDDPDALDGRQDGLALSRGGTTRITEGVRGSRPSERRPGA